MLARISDVRSITTIAIAIAAALAVAATALLGGAAPSHAEDGSDQSAPDDPCEATSLSFDHSADIDEHCGDVKPAPAPTDEPTDNPTAEPTADPEPTAGPADDPHEPDDDPDDASHEPDDDLDEPDDASHGPDDDPDGPDDASHEPDDDLDEPDDASHEPDDDLDEPDDASHEPDDDPSPEPTNDTKPTDAPTATPVPTVTLTPTPAPTPTASPATTPTPTPTPVPTPSFTPAPAPTAASNPAPTPIPNADLKITSASVNAPGLGDVGVPFTVTVAASAHNNGPGTPIDAYVIWNLAVPSGCTKSPNGTHTTANVSLPQSVSVQLTSPPWTITCNVEATHTWAARATVRASDPAVTDPTSFNNFRTALGTTTIDPIAFQTDTNCDGSVNAGDALSVLRHTAGIAPLAIDGCSPLAQASTATVGRQFGDLDCDGDVDPFDAVAILRFAVGMPGARAAMECGQSA